MKVDCGLSQSMIDRFREISASTPNVKKLILFGSRARGNFKYNSDIDLAFQSSGPVSSQYYFELEEAAQLYKLDLLDIDSINENLLLQQILQGVLIFERAP